MVFLHFFSCRAQNTRLIALNDQQRSAINCNRFKLKWTTRDLLNSVRWLLCTSDVHVGALKRGMRWKHGHKCNIQRCMCCCALCAVQPRQHTKIIFIIWKLCNFSFINIAKEQSFVVNSWHARALLDVPFDIMNCIAVCLHSIYRYICTVQLGKCALAIWHR